GRCPRRVRQPRAPRVHAACASPFRSEAEAASEDERFPTTALPATLHERGACAALHLERRATDQIPPRLRVGAAHARDCTVCVVDVQPTPRVCSEPTASGDAELVRNMAV